MGDVGNYVKGTSMPDAPASEVFHTCSPGKEIAGTGSPILYQLVLSKKRKKNTFVDIVRG